MTTKTIKMMKKNIHQKKFLEAAAEVTRTEEVAADKTRPLIVTLKIAYTAIIQTMAYNSDTASVFASLSSSFSKKFVYLKLHTEAFKAWSHNDKVLHELQDVLLCFFVLFVFVLALCSVLKLTSKIFCFIYVLENLGFSKKKPYNMMFI